VPTVSPAQATAQPKTEKPKLSSASRRRRPLAELSPQAIVDTLLGQYAALSGAYIWIGMTSEGAHHAGKAKGVLEGSCPS